MRNVALDKQKRVLEAVGLLKPGESMTPEQVAERFEPIQPVIVDLATGEPPGRRRPRDLRPAAAGPESFDQRRGSEEQGQRQTHPRSGPAL